MCLGNILPIAFILLAMPSNASFASILNPNLCYPYPQNMVNYLCNFLSFQTRADYFFTLFNRGIPFPFKGISPTPFAIEPYFCCAEYSGFPPLFSYQHPFGNSR